MYTIDTQIDIKTDEQMQYELQQKLQESEAMDMDHKMPQLNESAPSIHSMASQLTKILQQQNNTPSVIPKNKLRSKRTSKLMSPKIPAQRPNSISIFEREKDPNYIVSEREYLYLPYSFGQHMLYDYDHEFMLPTYSGLKKELVLNTKAPLNEYQWSIEDKKAEILRKTYKIPVDMTLDQMVALLVYCNYNELRQELQKSFSTSTKHKSYFHWAQLLFSVIKQFGVTDQELKTFPDIYCALNYPFKFYSFTHYNFVGLFSTTNDVSIVECCNTVVDGMILKLNRSQFCESKFINLSLIYSDFKDEQQQLFGCMNGCVLKIDEMFTCYDIRNNTMSYTHRNKQFIAALQLFEQIVIDIAYISDEKQYEWLKYSIAQAEQKSDDFDGNEFSVLQILQCMIYECLTTNNNNDNTRLSTIQKSIEIPTFINTQFGYFRHYLRDTEFCKLCFDMKKIELLPHEIQKYFVNNRIIMYANWCTLFPNDRVIVVKNIEENKYESFINLFATFVNEIGAPFTDCLQCIDIHTHCETLDEHINDMIQKKNESKFKYANWTLSYEIVTHQIGHKTKTNSYSILMSKNEIAADIETKDDNINNVDNSDEQKENKPNDHEIVQLQNKEQQNINETAAKIKIEMVDNIEQKENDENINEKENIEQSDENIIENKIEVIEDRESMTTEDAQNDQNEAEQNEENEENVCEQQTDNNKETECEMTQEQNEQNEQKVETNVDNVIQISKKEEKEENENEENEENEEKEQKTEQKTDDNITDTQTNNKENREPIMNDNNTRESISSIAPFVTDKVTELQNIKSKESTADLTPQSVDTWGTGTASPQPFSNRWGFNTDATVSTADNTPISVDEENKDNANIKTENTNELNITINDDDLDVEDKIWNEYINKYGYEPKTPSQLQVFSKNHDLGKHFSFKIAKQEWNKRTGKGKIKH